MPGATASWGPQTVALRLGDPAVSGREPRLAGSAPDPGLAPAVKLGGEYSLGMWRIICSCPDPRHPGMPDEASVSESGHDIQQDTFF